MTRTKPKSRARILAFVTAGAVAALGLVATPAIASQTQDPGDDLPAGSWWGVPDGTTSAGYDEHIPGYQFGCEGDELHKGLDIAQETGTTVHAWGTGEVVGTGYDDGGYHRWIQVYFPDIDMSMTLGHLLDGSEASVGTEFAEGDVLAEIGTEEDGITRPHVHYRAAEGNWGESAIGPCDDMDPFVIWDALGLPA